MISGHFASAIASPRGEGRITCGTGGLEAATALTIFPRVLCNAPYPSCINLEMPLIIILIVLLLLFGGGGYYMGPGVGYYGGGGVSLILAIVLIYLLFGRGRNRI